MIPHNRQSPPVGRESFVQLCTKKIPFYFGKQTACFLFPPVAVFRQPKAPDGDTVRGLRLYFLLFSLSTYAMDAFIAAISICTVSDDVMICSGVVPTLIQAFPPPHSAL